jgi:uncharacterized protein YycO
MFGDILFYRSDGSFTSHLIEWRTQSDVVHVAIRWDDTTQVAAMNNGVVLMEYQRTGLVYRPRPLISLPKQDSVRDWLHAQVGDEYSYEDIYDDILKLSGRALLIGRKAFDCSHLAAAFLAKWGDPAVSKFQHFETVTPGDLARACGYQH